MSNQEKKPSLSLLPKSGLWEAAAALTYGRDKHGRYAWKQGSHNLTELLDKALRHITQFADGEDYCSESKLLHLGSAAADLLIAIDVYHNQKHLDDRFETNKTLADVPAKTDFVDGVWTRYAKESIALAKQMQEPRTVAIPDYDIDSDNNTGGFLMLHLKSGMIIVKRDGSMTPVITDGTFAVPDGARIEWN